MVDEKMYNCPDGCMNIDKECMDCVEGDKFIPLIEFNISLRPVGSKDNPSYVIPVEKAYIKNNKLDLSKSINVTIKQ